MQVKMIQCQAGTDFVRNPGDVLDIPEAEAIRMIDAGIAVPLRDEPVETAIARPPGAETTQARKKKA